MEEMRALAADERRELGKLAAEQLGETIASPAETK
jgi:hypothetical protein